MHLTSPQKKALELLNQSNLSLAKGYWKIHGIFSGENPAEEFVEFDDDKFVKYPLEHENLEIGGQRYYKNKFPQTVGKKTMGELINKGLVELKITTTLSWHDIYAEITKYGRNVLSE